MIVAVVAKLPVISQISLKSLFVVQFNSDIELRRITSQPIKLQQMSLILKRPCNIPVALRKIV